MAENELLRLARIFHHAVRLPLALYAQDRCLYAAPEEPASASWILGGQDPVRALAIDAGRHGVMQYLNGFCNERFICLALQGGEMALLGPVATARAAPAKINRLGRLMRAEADVLCALQQHFNTIPLLTEDSYYYLGLLMVRQFVAAGAGEAEALSEEKVPAPAAQPPVPFEHPPYFLEQEMTRMISAGNKKQTLAILGEINRLSRATVAKDPVRSLKNSLIGSCALMSRAAIAGGVSAEAAFAWADRFILMIESGGSAKQLLRLEEDMAAAFADQVADCQQQRLSQPVQAALHYIEGRLQERLTVSLIARQVYVHADYLSVLFQREMGIRLSQYIKERRVQEAKNLLRHSRSSLLEVTFLLGFSSHSHFSRVFREHTGLTPAQFRKGAGDKAEIS